MFKQSIFLLFFTFLNLFACDGDCIKCHPTLIKSGSLDKNHKILAKCIDCHKITSNDLMRMGSLCGQDCWECHSVKKVMSIKIKEHQVLDKCINCHEKLYKNDLLFDNKENIFDLDKSILTY